jgi:hypothetical protein
MASHDTATTTAYGRRGWHGVRWETLPGSAPLSCSFCSARKEEWWRWRLVSACRRAQRSRVESLRVHSRQHVPRVNRQETWQAGRQALTATLPRTSWHGRTGELQDADAVADAGHDSRTLIPCADYDCARGGWRVMRLRLPGAMDGSLCAESVCVMG